ncbi:MAG: hypothetical protein K1X55_00165 [Chitinophagales bacterium]|nr:hypothetical protein [Chitinophagales bacterium]
MLTRPLGGILMLVSTLVFFINTFVYMNSSAYLDYNTGEKLSLSEAKVFFPYMFIVIAFVFGRLLWKNRELNSHH